MRLISRFFFAVGVVAIVAVMGSPASAAITWDGGVEPDDPTTWTSETNAYITAGTIEVDGGSVLPSNRFLVGYYGDGHLSITGGGAVTCANECYLGYGWYGEGAAIVDGVGSALTAGGPLYVGGGSSGELMVSNGGTVSSNYGSIGGDGGGVVTVDGVGSTWTSTESLNVSGSLTISNGGAIDVSGSTRISSGGISDLPVTFSNGTLSTGELYTPLAGLAGTGTVHARSLISDYDLIFDATHGLSQTLTIDELPGQNITLNLDVDGSGAIGAGFGKSMSISDGVVLSSTEGIVGLQGVGTVTVDGPGSTWDIRGDASIGDYGSSSRGSLLTITEGGLVSIGGTLKVGGFSAATSYINMSTNGMLALAGDADDSLVQFLDLMLGKDMIRYWDDAISDWADISGATYGDDYSLEYLTEGDLAGYTVLTVGVAPMSGDYDGDSDVDVADLMQIQRSGTDYDMEVWREHFGAGRAGDFDLDGDVDVVDLLAIQRSGTAQDLADWQAGFAAGAASGVTAVPEPGAFWLAVLGLIHRRVRRGLPAGH